MSTKDDNGPIHMARKTIPRTSFMGLPTELRLQIYQHLLKNEHLLDDPAAAKCCLWPSILAVSKQIFNEAMPILYGNNKIHVELEARGYEGCPRVEEALRYLPPYSFDYIIAACLSLKRPKWPSTRYWFDESFGFIRNDWDYLHHKMPNLKLLRIHIRVTKGDLVPTGWSIFEHLVSIPRLEIVEIRAFSDDRFAVSTPELASLTMKLVERLHRRAEPLSKRLIIRGLPASENTWRSIAS